MKILTKEEQQEHYNATVTGGLLGGVAGLSAGLLGVYAASARYPAFRSLTLPLRAFLVTSSGTFASIVSADSYSRAYERKRHPELQYEDSQASIQEQARALRSTKQKTLDWMSENRYGIVFGSWVASMGTALGIVGRSPYLTTAQKLVQARVYAQGLTVAVMIISLAFETSDSSKGRGRWETVKVLDPNDPEHKHLIEKKVHHEAYAGEDQWRDMVEAEEKRLKQREEARKARQKKRRSDGDQHQHQQSEKSEDSQGSSESEKSGSSSTDDRVSKSSKSERSDGGNGEKSKASSLGNQGA